LNGFRFQKASSPEAPHAGDSADIPLPNPEMIPNDSRVEIDAKINAGYFTTGKHYTMEDLQHIKGRGWEKWEDVTVRAGPPKTYCS
jgi:hypothetical protein